MRLFIGIEIPAEIKLEIFKFLAPLQNPPKGWEHSHDYHQTLLFIGESTPEQLEIIKSRMSQFRFKPFDVETSSFEFFSRRILYLSLKPSQKLLDLSAEIYRIFPEWVRPNEKEFLSHITVKRWQRYEYLGLVEGLKNRELPSMKFAVNSLALFVSQRDENNLKYHVIYRQPFDANPQLIPWDIV